METEKIESNIKQQISITEKLKTAPLDKQFVLKQQLKGLEKAFDKLIYAPELNEGTRRHYLELRQESLNGKV